MIVVTRLNATRMALNADLIERIQESPDTVVLMANGAKYVVRESMDQVIDLITGYHAQVIDQARARHIPESAFDPDTT
ncbi:flagellar FlbD family protein [Glutamicibacter creatinolyticus]|uniref:flagellar FlbD family protein n=1 Tax=Glutamicibacter creatinolyticus TaxID=162496 RepID=UPI003409313C